MRVRILRQWKRKRILRQTIPEEWFEFLRKDVSFFSSLSASDLPLFFDHLRVFFFEKHFIGAHGSEVTEKMKVIISASAARLSMNRRISDYDALSEVVVFPQAGESADEETPSLPPSSIAIVFWSKLFQQIRTPVPSHEVENWVEQLSLGKTNAYLSQAGFHPWAPVFWKLFQRESGHSLLQNLDQFTFATQIYFEGPEVFRQKMPEVYQCLNSFYARSGT